MQLEVDLSTVLSACVGVILPVLVGIVTKKLTSPAVQAVLLAFFAAVSGFLSQWLAAINGGAPFSWQVAAFTWLMTFVTAVATHYGFWKPTGVSSAVQSKGGVTILADHRRKRDERGRFAA